MRTTVGTLDFDQIIKVVDRLFGVCELFGHFVSANVKVIREGLG
ncbi:hypothetical protein VDG1235_1324 [Verrucomicrobiia bacterium DG1235]|nr:hypothetical protein VDG1235_1324 [Verrucomicrobiae bacterium DG1235]